MVIIPFSYYPYSVSNDGELHNLEDRRTELREESQAASQDIHDSGLRRAVTHNLNEEDAGTKRLIESERLKKASLEQEKDPAKRLDVNA